MKVQKKGWKGTSRNAMIDEDDVRRRDENNEGMLGKTNTR